MLCADILPNSAQDPFCSLSLPPFCQLLKFWPNIMTRVGMIDGEQ